MFLKRSDDNAVRVPEFPSLSSSTTRNNNFYSDSSSVVSVNAAELAELRASLSAHEAALKQRTRLFEESQDMARRILSDFKSYSYTIATTTVDDLVKLRRAQEVTKVAVGVVKNTGTAEQKQALATALKEMSQRDDSRKVRERERERRDSGRVFTVVNAFLLFVLCFNRFFFRNWSANSGGRS